MYKLHPLTSFLHDNIGAIDWAWPTNWTDQFSTGLHTEEVPCVVRDEVGHGGERDHMVDVVRPPLSICRHTVAEYLEVVSVREANEGVRKQKCGFVPVHHSRDSPMSTHQ